MLSSVFCISSGTVLLAGLASGSASAQDVPVAISPKTERVVVLSIDGIRNQEGFRHPVAPGGVHPYIPRIWSEIKPQGTVYTEMMLLEKASTTTGIVTLYSGTWNHGPNRLSTLCECEGGFRENRSHTPLVSEHVVKDLGLPTESVGFYHNKRNTLVCDYSFHPNYGSLYAPGSNVFVDAKDKIYPYREDLDKDGIYEFVDDLNGDDVLMDQLRADLAFVDERSNYPTLILGHFGVVDLAGHVGQFGLYTDAIRNADAMVADFWQFLQSHPVYRDRTTLIVTTDHGRHDDEHGGFRAHNGNCYGCRNLFFCAIGPDTPKDLVVTRTAYMIDVAPSVGALLGLDLPHAEGRVLREMVLTPDPVVERIRDHRTLSVGSEFLLAATQETGEGGTRTAVWRGVPDEADVAFGDPVPVSSSGAKLSQHPTLCLSSSGGVVVAFRELLEADSLWQIRRALSSDLGETFGLPAPLLQGRREAETRHGFRMVVAPTLQAFGARDDLLVPLKSAEPPDHLVRVMSDDGFATVSGVEVAVRTEDSVSFTSEFEMVSAVDLQDGSYGMTWVQLDHAFQDDPTQIFSYEVYYRRVFGSSQGDVVRITDDPNPSFHPALGFDPVSSTLYLTYAVRDSGLWQVFLRESVDGGANFSPPVQVTSSSGGAWKPAPIWDADGDRLVIVYEDYRDGGAEVYWTSYDGSTFGVATNLSTTPSVSRAPQAVRLDDGSIFATWEEYEPSVGRFEPRGKRLP